MKDKLILKVYKSAPSGNEQGVIKIEPNAYQKLLELQRASGYPIRQLASRMIEFACENVEIEVE